MIRDRFSLVDVVVFVLGTGTPPPPPPVELSKTLVSDYSLIPFIYNRQRAHKASVLFNVCMYLKYADDIASSECNIMVHGEPLIRKIKRIKYFPSKSEKKNG